MKSGRVPEDNLKIAVVAGQAPGPLREHLEMNAADYGGDYSALRERIQPYLLMKEGGVGTIAPGGHAMEVDFMSSGSGGGGGSRTGVG